MLSTVARWVVIIGLVAAELVITVAGTWIYFSSAGRVLDADEVPPGSTALVLGSLVDDGLPGSYVRGRLDTAVDLYENGRVARIINSGNGSAAAGDEPAVMRSYLEERGVPADVIVDDPLGMDTDASCRRAHEVFGVRRAVIVTQDFHVSRAIALCRSWGIDATGVAARCECATWTVLRNHLRELLLARPRALVGLPVQDVESSAGSAELHGSALTT
ncbi:MAG: ElyC/SanA/YdcF family protein [Actinomycetota bacterium]|nr:ElyC/SanA/YdcF family protein [Actinomycetota bacterium]